MKMNRRSFLGTVLALGAAPAIVHAASLMPLVVREPMIILPGYREIRAYDIMRDQYRYRLDTWDGVNQASVDFKTALLPGHAMRAEYLRAKNEASRSLDAYVRKHWPHSTFYAPPTPPGVTPAGLAYPSSLQLGPFFNT